jgi:hypothetical protein
MIAKSSTNSKPGCLFETTITFIESKTNQIMKLNSQSTQY